MPRFILLVTLIIVILGGCIQQPNSFPKLPPGEWRGVLKLTDPEVGQLLDSEEKVKDYFELPFNLEVTYVGDNMQVYLVNGTEKIPIENVQYGRDPATAKDTIKFDMTAFDTAMEGFYEENFIEGYWIVNYKEGYKIPFLAQYGQNHRFLTHPEPDTENFDGKWKVMFEYDSDDAYPAIAEFHQDGNQLNGTFLTETGDYRYLAGNAFGDKLRLSVFDGSHAFLFRGSLQSDTIIGEFRSGKHYKSKWYAVRDDAFMLTDAYNMTAQVKSEEVTFTFPNTKGEEVTLSKPGEGGQIKILSIMGTWCPNCKDEVIYLKELQEKYGSQLELYTIAYERYRDEQKAMDALIRYKEVSGMDWSTLLGGYADKTETTESLPFLTKIYSYPTMVIMDNNNKIRHIHTGFNGPATSKYESFKKDMKLHLEDILAE